MKTPLEDPKFQVARRRMVEEQLRARGITDDRVLDAMERVPRQQFVDDVYWSEIYEDHPVPVAEGQTISQPYMVAIMLQALRLLPESSVLEIGTGTGYQAALLAEIANSVVTVERLAPLAELARKNLEALHIDNVEVVHGDGTLGHPPRAPYDRIIVAAAAPEAPGALIDQLAEGGILLVPVGDFESQTLRRISRTHGKIEVHSLAACRFVPLIGEQGNPPR